MSDFISHLTKLVFLHYLREQFKTKRSNFINFLVTVLSYLVNQMSNLHI